MNDGRVDSLIRRLDVQSNPAPAYVEASYRILARVAAEELRQERTIAGRIRARIVLAWPLVVPPRRLATVLLLALLALAIALASAALVGRRSTAPTWLPSQILFGRATDNAYDLWAVGTDGRNERLFLPAPREVSRVSHDGTRIAVATHGTALVFPIIMNADGSHALEMHPDPTLNLGAMAWSHDGAWLAFESWDATNADRDGIYLMRADGSGLHRLTSKGVPGDFSPDDRQIVLTRQEGLFVVNVDGTGERQVGTLKPEDGPGYMPDGRSLYAGAEGSIWIIDLATGAPSKIAIQGGRAHWIRLSPDGTRFAIVYEATGATNTAIWTINVDGSGLAKVADAPDRDDVFPDWLP
jgi:Tol biopolymer transport system component